MAEIESTSNSDFAAALRQRDHWRIRASELVGKIERLQSLCGRAAALFRDRLPFDAEATRLHDELDKAARQQT